MKKKIIIQIMSLLCVTFGVAQTKDSREEACRPTNLRCEHLVRPLGIDCATPRFSWQLDDERNGALQTAYRITVDKDSAALAKGKIVLWQEKKSDDRMMTTYSGKTLEPFTRYYWSITVWDKDNVQSRPVISSFETGMLGQTNWEGTFISDGQDRESRETPYFRKSIRIDKPVTSARAYIVAAGLYELSLNGEKVGNHFLDPAFTDFGKRLLYVTYDITSALRQGDNAVGVILGNGWYNHQPVAEWGFHNAPWRSRPSFCLNIRIRYADETEECISSDESFKVAAGPITFNAIYVAENYDFRRDMLGWNTPAFDDSEWRNAVAVTKPTAEIISQSMYPIRITDFRTPIEVKRLNDTLYLYDFGQNWSGVTSFTIGKGTEGVKIKLKHGEQLDSRHKRIFDDNNTQFYQNVNEPLKYGKHPEDELFQTDVLVLSEDGGTFMPRFNYKGFRYVEVSSDKPLQLEEKNLTSYFVHTDVPQIGTFECSDTLINRLWRATNYSYLSNLMGYPTDCPQREKNGWTGDAHLAIETALYNYDGITLYEKWMDDHRDNMQPDGGLCCIIPSGGWGKGALVDWTCSMTIIPWSLYEYYGDPTCLKENYEQMKRHTTYWIKKYPDGLIPDACLGDWIPHKSVANKELTASIYHYKNADIVAKTAQLFGYGEDYTHFRAEAEKIKASINKKFLDRTSGIYANGYQTELSMPLYWGIVPEDCVAKVAEQLSARVTADKDHIDFGIMGCKTVMNALVEAGYAEQAFRMVSQVDYPSWGNWLRQGATTLYENWDYNGMAWFYSQNHIMYGEISAWLYKTLAGIKVDPQQPGFKNILLRPHFIGELMFVKASYFSPYGEIKSEWERKGDTVLYRVKIPANASATLFLEGEQSPRQLLAGSYEFTVKSYK